MTAILAETHKPAVKKGEKDFGSEKGPPNPDDIILVTEAEEANIAPTY